MLQIQRGRDRDLEEHFNGIVGGLRDHLEAKGPGHVDKLQPLVELQTLLTDILFKQVKSPAALTDHTSLMKICVARVMESEDALMDTIERLRKLIQDLLDSLQ